MDEFFFWGGEQESTKKVHILICYEWGFFKVFCRSQKEQMCVGVSGLYFRFLQTAN